MAFVVLLVFLAQPLGAAHCGEPSARISTEESVESASHVHAHGGSLADAAHASHDAGACTAADSGCAESQGPLDCGAHASCSLSLSSEAISLAESPTSPWPGEPSSRAALASMRLPQDPPPPRIPS
jgi:hypothetical protein